jgi:protein SCO1
MTTRSASSACVALLMGPLLLVLSATGLATPAPVKPDHERSVQSMGLPAFNLQRADGQSLPLSKALSDGRPVVLTFMYSSCQTVCPITNQVMTELETLLGARRQQVHLISISIDPDHDTVQQLARYAKATGHKGSFFTADPATSEAVQRAFNVWRGDKMNHEPVFLLSKNAVASRQWLRLTGLVAPKTLLSELRALAPQALSAPPVAP